MTNKKLVRIISKDQEAEQLKAALEIEQELLHRAEARLAEAQAGVNAFRMHCRLKLGPWVDEIIELYIEKQRLLTHQRLSDHANAEGLPFTTEDWLSQPPEYSELEEEAHIADLAETIDVPFDITSRDEKSLRKLYRSLAKRFHPDFAEGALAKSYSTSMMAAVNEAYSGKDIQTLFDLAGKPDPETAAELKKSTSQSNSVRKLKATLVKCRQMKRRATLRYNLLQQENITKLWLKASSVDQTEGQNWWDEVASALKSQIDMYKSDINEISGKYRSP